MPDQPYDLDAVKARQAAARQHAATQLDTHLHPHTIAHCQLCDDDGYRGTTICDHHDHYATTTNGRAAVTAELAKIRNRRNPGARA